jgi:tetratricopeptide (TPR) repeat protein
MTDRLSKIQAMLQTSPDDAFLHYAASLEHRKSNDLYRALASLDRTIAIDPNYSYAYFQKGQVLEEQGQPGQASRAYQAGLEAARRAGDARAMSELQAALDLL